MARTTRAEESYFTIQINAQNKNFITAEFSHDEVSIMDLQRNPHMYIVTRGDGTSQRDIRIVTPYQLEQEFDLPKNYRRGAFTKITPKAINIPSAISKTFVVTYYYSGIEYKNNHSSLDQAIKQWDALDADPEYYAGSLAEVTVWRRN
ncbi:hypothetical protein MUDCAT_78 [Arthrobacter phage Mudcat]|nr:hypothetical protein BI184_gp78 [Arthrobacter phage Mudcat]YP_010666270.1 hypothetical protein PQB76_gp083 [Arthrobacter phage Cheesy]YP_010666560.1 hypothetical protein PQB79_gp081 [Arthrobacter phage Heisenberger]YP_010666660.1 hypothetical protein PQB80_gp081 [Arthrobacter phage JEGGS]AMM44445.1 hypothetical protein MUDCAT_78 [Arthrobacter phage Mudcat]ASR80335.1 hypothetical protein SEA_HEISENBERGER_81 [Arthrobacter phage Heisenberger]ASR84662.1 hypothetical protein SEA_CHEESY_83 [Arth